VVGQLLERPRHVLRVAALNDEDDIDEILRAAGADPADLEPAVSAALAEPDGAELRLRHPLIRSALVWSTPPEERRRIHGSLAEAVHDPDRRTLHLAQATDGLDDDLAELLSDLAARHHRRGAVRAAVSAWRRAAELSTEPELRAGRMFRAMDASFEVGDAGTVRRLDGLVDAALLGDRDRIWLALLRDELGGPGLVLAERLRAYIAAADSLRSAGRVDEAYETLQWVIVRLYFTNLPPGGAAAVTAFVERTGRDAGDPRAATLLGLAEPIGRGRAVIESLPAHLGRADLEPSWQLKLGWTALSLGAVGPAAALLTAVIERCRAQQRVGTLTQALFSLSVCGAVTGNARLAARAAAEAGRLAAESGQPRWQIVASLITATAAALRGRPEAAARAADRAAGRLRQLDGFPLLCFVNLARGTAALAAGDPRAAAAHLGAVFDPAGEAFHPSARFWILPTYAEAAVLAGRHDELRARLDELTPVLERCGSPLLAAGIVTGRALLSIEDYPGGDAAVALAQWPFEKARLDHAYGVWLRRRRRHAEARPFLRSAAAVFAASGAEAWADRSRRELRSAGETALPPGAAGDLLSPQELQVAELVAQGLSNREIGSRLFLSPRTVGSHLYRIFPKLGIATRGEVARALGLDES